MCVSDGKAFGAAGRQPGGAATRAWHSCCQRCRPAAAVPPRGMTVTCRRVAAPVATACQAFPLCGLCGVVRTCVSLTRVFPGERPGVGTSRRLALVEDR